MEERHGQQTIEYVRPGSLSAFNLSRLPRRQRKRRISSRDVRPDSKVSPKSSVRSHEGPRIGISINPISTSILTGLTSRKRTQKTSKKAQEALKELSKEYQMSTLGELKWFLGIYVLHDRSQRLLWLPQEAYIE